MHHLQAVLQSRPRPPPGFSDPDAAKPLVLQPGSKAVWVGANYFGAVATVLADPAAKITGKSNQGAYYVRVQVRMWGVCLFVGKGVCVDVNVVWGAALGVGCWQILRLKSLASQ